MDMGKLTRRRRAVKHKLTDYVTFVDVLVNELKNKNNVDEKLDKFRVRANDFKTIWVEYEEIQNEIESAVQEDGLTDEYKLRDAFYAKYIDYVVITDRLISQISAMNDSVVKEAPKANLDANYSSVRLPVIELPKFDGDYSTWLEFRDTFQSLINKNDSISEIQKFHYLKASLMGDAMRMIQSLDFSASNYAIAWDLLAERYSNKRLLVQNHIKQIFEANNIQKESARSIRNLVDNMAKHVRALQALGELTQNWDSMLIYIITSKLDKKLIKDWEMGFKADDKPTFKSLKSFLADRADFLETFELNHSSNKMGETRRTTLLAKEWKRICNFCKDDHLIGDCKEFLKLSVKERYEKCKQLKLCVNCLCYGHWSRKCKSKPCRECHNYHNILLHDTGKSKQNQSNEVSLMSSNTVSTVLLQTVVILVKDNNDKWQRCRAILDNGSMSNLITSKFMQKLKLKKEPINISLVGINNAESVVKYKCLVTVKSNVNKFQHTMSCLVVNNRITDRLPIENIPVSSWKLPNDLSLADPNFNVPSEVDMLIGSELFWNLLKNEQIRLGKGLPILQNTLFGWVVSGGINRQALKSYTNFVQLSSHTSDDLDRFWELEEVDQKNCSDLDICGNYFKNTTIKDKEGRFIVRIPLKMSRDLLGDSKEVAIKRFLSLEKRFARDLEFKQAYSEFIREYLNLGHMEGSKLPIDDKCYYLPHHGIVRPDSTTTKLRVVFDGSAKSSSGLSLNDIQYKGSIIPNDIVDILIRFRQHEYVVCADIAKMYRQVWIHKSDRSLQQIVWRDHPSDNIQFYTLKTITYGTASAPYLAIKCIKQIAEDCRDEFPISSEIINKDFYVDDLITGFSSIAEAKFTCFQLDQILKKSGFQLRKWSSNDDRILGNTFDLDNDTELRFMTDEIQKMLGMVWSRKQDLLSFSTVHFSNKLTKRAVLSDISKLYDPLGLISPCIVSVKLLIQKMWTLNLEWDEELPVSLSEEWLKSKRELGMLSRLEVPRRIICKHATATELHGFSDASQQAYGAVIYLKCINILGQVNVRLIASKTKVAPLRQKLTIPKLELMGSLLLANLKNKVTNALMTKVELKCFLYSDSQIVLAWLKGKLEKLPRFEANRVVQIKKLTEDCSWAYINTKDNPADMASRGLRPSEIINNNLWWQGPELLKKCADIQMNCFHLIQEQTNNIDLFQRYSSLKKLKRVFAYCLRFAFNAKRSNIEKRIGHLTVNELSESLQQLIKLAQVETFQCEINKLKKDKQLDKNDKLIALNPFLDKDDVMRVGGRLRYSDQDFDAKHPIVLSGCHSLTRLIIHDEHKRLMHAGPQLLLSSIRLKYWPTAGMNAIKRVTRNCIICYRQRPIPISNLMADLPEDRVRISGPFSHTGIDYAGPFLIKDRRGRGSKLYKAYVCVFICFTTKAMHLEVITNLSTESFIACLRRFSSRRGKPQCIHSDNATTFIGAKNELCELYNFLKNSGGIISEICANDNIQWKFIPPRAPHFGGLWESAVKSFKYHLSRVVGNNHLLYHEFETILVQIEAILNSRPMYSISNDPNDFLPLTPAHFLIGKPIVAVPDPDVTEIKINKLSRLQLLQNIQQGFWKIWSREYFSSLQRRNKWTTEKPQLDIGSLVLIKEETLPSCKWHTGRVVQLHPGKDGLVRVVTVKTPHGEFKRAVTKLCLLPIPVTQNGLKNALKG